MTNEANFQYDEDNRINSEFSAEKFMNELLTEGEKANCDETSDAFNNNFDIPPFYDDNLYKKGQEYFRKNLAALFNTSLLGLIVLGCRPTLKLLVLTQKSCTALKAYKRYLATILYMMDWYDHDFKPGTQSWRSLGKVRQMHNSASKLGHQKLKYRISQMEMAITQFGFIGFAVIRGRYVGLHDASDEDLKGLIHVWRVIGYALGIEDRYNLCRESVKETKEIFEDLLTRLLIPGMQQVGKDFYDAEEAVVGGFQGMVPSLRLDVILHYLHMVMDSNDDVTNCAKDHLAPLDETGKRKLKLLFNMYWALQYPVFKFIMNVLMCTIIWFWKNFPIAAYWKFGINESKVKV